MLQSFLGAWGVGYSSVSRSNTTYSSTNVTTSGTAYNNITPVQLVASTPFDVAAIQLRCGTTFSATGTRRDAVVEVMAGAASSEYTIIGPVDWGARQSNTKLTLPIFIPQGTRLSIRIRATELSAVKAFALDLFSIAGDRESAGLPTQWIAYGLVDDGSANARGTIVVPGNTNTWGSWTAITTSTTYAHDLWMPHVGGGTLNSGTTVANTYRSQFAFDTTANAATAATNGTVVEGPGMATGTAESIGSNFQGGTTAATILGVGGDNFGLVRAPLPAGSAVSVRAMCSGTHSTNAFAASILAAI